jgi:hypothetical protein
MDTPQEQLEHYMHVISQDYFAAGWLMGLEYTLWDWVTGVDHAERLKYSNREYLMELALKAGGWVIWDANLPEEMHKKYGERTITCGNRFVTFAEWDEIRKEHNGANGN